MLKKGLAWHYTAYDQRWELETVSGHYSLLTPALEITHSFPLVNIIRLKPHLAESFLI
jgi:hypothetical protein